MLEVIHEQILSEDALKQLVAAANRYLADESRKPAIDVKPLKAKESKLRKEIDRLLQRVKAATNESLIAAYESDIIRSQSELKAICADIAGAMRANEPVPPALDLKLVKSYVKESRAILSQEIPAAAEAIRRLTGPIMVSQEAHSHTKQGAVWILKFTPDALGFLRDLSVRLSYPDSRTMEFLWTGKWIVPQPVEISLGSAGWHRSKDFAKRSEQIQLLLAAGKT